MSLWVGLGGATRDACVALCTRDRVLGACGQERITRIRGAGFDATGLPEEALRELLQRADRREDEVTSYVLAEDVRGPEGRDIVRLEHHFAHACAAFLPSPYDSATIVVCDHDSPHVSVWNGEGGTVSRVDRTWLGPGFAELYTECAQVLGFVGAGSEQRLEAMARLDPSAPAERFSNLFGFGGDHLQLLSDWRSQIECSVSGADFRVKAGVAAELQARIGQRLLEFVASVKCHAPARTKLCVGGSLFLNSYFNSLVRSSGLFEDVFVPVNPANGGLAIGGALHASGQARRAVTPFLGPSYSPHDVKATLDNCKLTYEWASEAETISIAVDALQHGRLVAWFDGPMEWGSRALGARSILANPRQPHVLENLNHFLKQRDPWRGYALSGVESAVRDHFDGPVRSPFMECDYTPKDRDLFRHILPWPQAAIRVHTVGTEAPDRFVKLLQAFEDASKVPFLVNTSFNGFREPIVCTPRDAVRVFYGSGIDVLILGEFVVRK